MNERKFGYLHQILSVKVMGWPAVCWPIMIIWFISIMNIIMCILWMQLRSTIYNYALACNQYVQIIFFAGHFAIACFFDQTFGLQPCKFCYGQLMSTCTNLLIALWIAWFMASLHVKKDWNLWFQLILRALSGVPFTLFLSFTPLRKYVRTYYACTL